MRLPGSGGARSPALWALSAGPYPELPNSQEAPGIWCDPRVWEEAETSSGLRRSCLLLWKEGREGGVQPPALVSEREGWLLVVVPGAVETLGFSKQGNRSRSCRAYAPTFCRERGKKKPRLFEEGRFPLPAQASL